MAFEHRLGPRELTRLGACSILFLRGAACTESSFMGTVDVCSIFRRIRGCAVSAVEFKSRAMSWVTQRAESQPFIISSKRRDLHVVHHLAWNSSKSKQQGLGGCRGPGVPQRDASQRAMPAGAILGNPTSQRFGRWAPIFERGSDSLLSLRTSVVEEPAELGSWRNTESAEHARGTQDSGR